jgi:solute carrier family 25 phosphate transporter 3
MYPFEQIRVRVQTGSVSLKPPRLARSTFRGLGPLLARQVPGTIANLYTFENTVYAIYRYILVHPKESYSPTTQLSITLASGYVAGIACAVASHPADSLLSLLTKNPTSSLRQIVETVGWSELMTRGLAPRVVTMGTVIAGQWYVYDCFKTIMGMGTTGG